MNPKKTLQKEMNPPPISVLPDQSNGKLFNQVAVITGGDSGIGRAVAMLFAKEGADTVISYLSENTDALDTKRQVEIYGRKCITHAGDIGNRSECKKIIEKAKSINGRIDILINNAATQTSQETVEKISPQQLDRTFRTNVFAYFYMVQATLPFMSKGGRIINTTSVVAYRGSEHLLDYSATKGAVVTFTCSLSKMLVSQGIRVNAVAPGPIWTPLIPSTFSKEKVKKFGKDVPMGRRGEPAEVAPSFLFLASQDSSYMTGQVLHPNGGEMVES